MKNRLRRYQEGAEDEQQLAAPSDAHLRAVAFIDEMLSTMMSSNTALTPIVKLMHRARPAILRDLAQIPAEQLQSFLVDLGGRMITAGCTMEETHCPCCGTRFVPITDADYGLDENNPPAA